MADNNQLQTELEKRNRSELDVASKKLKLRGTSRLTKPDLIMRMLECDQVALRRALEHTWWDRHHNTVYGWASIIGIPVAVLLFMISRVNPTPRFVYETEGDLSKAKRDLEVLESHIVDANKGFMRIRISKEFLNYKFSIPITVRYKAGRYEPVTLTFQNNPTRGPGIIVTSPEREKRVACHLFDGLKFRGFGPPTFTEDLVLRFYYNNKMAFFKAESGLIEFLNTPPGRYKPPPILPGHLYMEYFVELSQEEKARGRSDYEELKEWFEIHRPAQ